MQTLHHCLASSAAYLPEVGSDVELNGAGHGVQMECSREKASEILEQQLQGLDKAVHTTGEEVKVKMLSVSGR